MAVRIFLGEQVWDNTLRVLMRHSWQPKAFVGELSVQVSVRSTYALKMMPNGGRVSVLPWAGGPDPSPPRWGLTTWLSAPPTLAADVFGRSPLGSVDECVAVQLRARWPLTVHTWKEPEREALGRARALPLRGSRGQKAGARSSGAGPSPACPPLAARVLKGRGRGHPHHVVNKPAINEGRGVITLPSCSSLQGAVAEQVQGQLVAVTLPSQSHLECNLRIALIFYCSARLFTGATLLPIS